MSIRRFSFNETTDWKEAIGFQVRISLNFDILGDSIIIQKGSLIFGFKDGINDIYGFVLDNNVELSIPETIGDYYFITIDAQGTFRLELGNNNIRGIGASVNDIPWYTFNGRALIGKILRKNIIITGYIVCDDPYWCEFMETY